MPTLHDVQNDIIGSLWCGPAALSAVTGRPVSQIVEIAKRLSGKRVIKGMSFFLMIKVAHELGYEMKCTARFMTQALKRGDAGYGRVNGLGHHQYLDTTSRPTVAAWCRENRAALAKDIHIIGTTGHYVVVFGRRFVDNHTKTIVPLNKAPHRRTRIERVFTMRKYSATVRPVVELSRHLHAPAVSYDPETGMAMNPKPVRVVVAAPARLNQGLELWRKAGCPTKEQFIAVYGPEGPKMTWEQRAAAGVPAERFQQALSEKKVVALRAFHATIRA